MMQMLPMSGDGADMNPLTWGAVRHLVIADESQVDSDCKDAVMSVIPGDSVREVEVGFPLAGDLLNVYRYRYQSIDAFRRNRSGWNGFFSALESCQGRIGLLSIGHSGWRFIILLSEDLDTALACLCRPPTAGDDQKGETL